jgi:hypothetical protein
MKITAFLSVLAIAGAASAAELPMTPAAKESPEQAAMRVVQQQRNQALAQASDMQATIAYLQATAVATAKYWESYVKGLSPVEPKAEPTK